MKEDKSAKKDKFSRLVGRGIKNMRLRISLPFVSYEVDMSDIISGQTEDERIASLGNIKKELQDAIFLVDELSLEAGMRKNEIDKLRKEVEQLHDEQTAVEKVLSLPRETFAKLINRASSKGQIRGLIIGGIIGLVTGFLSSLIVWFFTG